MKLKHIVYSFCILLMLVSCGKQKISVGLVVNDQIEQKTELDSLIRLLDKQSDEVTYKIITMSELSSLGEYDVVWYHRPDSVEISKAESDAGTIFKEYVEKGGQLMLSMDAVRLLNAWNIEPETIQSKNFEAKDKGFGRKVGFHAFREHPIFHRLFGGAYTWHGKEDNSCRVLGFWDDNLPKAPDTKIIGTLWEYIYYHPEDKILWETSFGKGRILAIGGCLYFGKENFHTQIQDQFISNCLHYLKGDTLDKKEMLWQYGSVDVQPSDDKYEAVTLTAATTWNLPETKNTLTREAEASYYFDLPSQRSILVGSEKGGIDEIWTHPFMSLRDFRTYLSIEGIDTLVALKAYTPQFEIRANAVIRTYKIGDLLLKEIITNQVNEPVTVVHYEWEGNGLKSIVTDYKSNLRFMWPYDENALGSLYYNWSSDLNAFVVTDKNKEFCSLVGANVKGELIAMGRFDDFTYKGTVEGVATEKLQVAASVSYNVADIKAMDVLIAAGNTGVDKVLADYKATMQKPFDIFATSNTYYEDYLKNNLTIVTPDATFNEGLRWAILSSSQFIVETPGIGTSLMAGYSTSRRGWGGAHKVSGRPGYAWYFGRDAIWAGFAFNGLGDYATVKKILETLIHFQEVDGKIYHELSSSGSVHFDASDASPLFVNLMAHYLRNSGDIEFVKANMPAIHKAMDYCYSTDTDGDHLIEISNVGHGWLEGGKLYGAHTEFYLVGVWNAALLDAAYLSEVTGNEARVKQYQADAQTVNKIINTDFWNPKGYYNYGKHKDGSFTDEFISLTSVPVYFGVTDSDKSQQMVKQFASAAFSTDWGVRMLGGNHALFNPTSYHFGSVWPLFTGWTSLAEYQSGRYSQGFTRIMSNLINYKKFALGRVPEVINGSVYKPSGVTLHQCWSETMVFQPLIEGMLGFKPDAVNNALTLAPRIPFDWATLEVSNLRVANNLISFDMKREKNKTTYSFKSTAPLKMQFQPSFALGTRILKITVNGKDVTFETLPNQEYLTIDVNVALKNETVVAIEYQDGASALSSIVEPQIDKESSGFRLMEQSLNENVLTVIVEGTPGTTNTLELYLPDGYESITGGTEAKELRTNVHGVNVQFEKSTKPYVTKEVKVVLKKQK